VRNAAASQSEAINAFLLILWSGEISYVRPFFPPQARKKRVPGGPGFGGMAASGSVSWSTPLAKMLYVTVFGNKIPSCNSPFLQPIACTAQRNTGRFLPSQSIISID
jgi:hypothetical protein